MLTTESIVNALSGNSAKDRKKCSTCGKSHEGKCRNAAKVGAVTTDDRNLSLLISRNLNARFVIMMLMIIQPRMVKRRRVIEPINVKNSLKQMLLGESG